MPPEQPQPTGVLTSPPVLAVAGALPVGVVLLSSSGIIVFANARIERLLGYPVTDLVGRPVDLLIPGFLIEHLPSTSDEVGSWTPLDADHVLLMRRRDGSERLVDARFTRVDGPEGTTIVMIVPEAPSHASTDARLQELLEFEQLIANLATQFINVHLDAVDDVIRTALEGIGETLNLDRCTFFRLESDSTTAAPVYWCRPGVADPPAGFLANDRFPDVWAALRAGRVWYFSSVDDIPDPTTRAGYRAQGIRSAVTVPLAVEGRLLGAVGFNTFREEREWTPELLHRLKVFAGAFASVLARRENDRALRQAHDEVKRLRDQLQAENTYLRAEAKKRLHSGGIVGEGLAIRRVLEQVEQVAATNSTVLLLGETGTGKERFATQLHEWSSRSGRAMVRVNCAAIPHTLLESELFGREKGAFTGALSQQVGRFEMADQSSIFLDEIGDLPLDVQVKLLRVLEERTIERLGSPKPIRIDARIIAATHRNLEERIAAGTFRADLYYRLNVFPIRVPPLRERIEDIRPLVWHFVEEFSKSFGKRIAEIPDANMTALQAYRWPGNIRELRNVIERAMILATGPRLTIPIPSTSTALGPQTPGERLVDVEADHVRTVLERTGWRIRGPGGAAERLGLRPTTLETRMAKLGLRRPVRGASGS